LLVIVPENIRYEGEQVYTGDCLAGKLRSAIRFREIIPSGIAVQETIS